MSEEDSLKSNTLKVIESTKIDFTSHKTAGHLSTVINRVAL
jgi:hypothetical protein